MANSFYDDLETRSADAREAALLAAADAPARPVPTTMTWYFRLFAGFTSFIPKRCFSHFSASGPGGTFDFSFMRSYPR